MFIYNNKYTTNKNVFCKKAQNELFILKNNSKRTANETVYDILSVDEN